jgi:hypothetical protein
MSLEDRFRQAFDDAIAEVRSRLESQFTSTLTDVRAEAEREKAEALAALEDAKRTELAAADEARAAALAAAEEAKAAALGAAEEARASALAAAEEAQAAALEAAKGSLEAELQTAFQSEKASITSNHDTVIAQLREAVESDRNRLLDEAATEAARLREAADTAAMAAKEELEHATTEAARQRDELEAALTQAKDAAAADVEKARAEAQAATAAHSQALDAQLTGAIRLLESVRALDGAASLTEVLDALTFAAAKEAGRSAMLVVKGDRLIGWRTTGFGIVDDEPRAIESSTSDVDALAAAVNTGRPAVVGSGSVLAAPSFSDLPPDRAGLAVPLLVAGRPVAVLYADPGAAAPLSPGWTSPVEVLVRHAGRCLEAIAVSRGHAKAAAARVGSPA